MTDNNEQTYGGRWRVIEEIGRGGQGVVYEVLDTTNAGKDVELLEKIRTVLRERTVPRGVLELESASRKLIELIRELSNVAMRRRTALKTLLTPEQAVNANTALDRMKSEIEAMRQVRHPSSIDVLDEGDNHRWFVTDLYSNGTLAAKLESFEGQVPNSLQALRPVVEAVSLLHKADVVHRDIKPENIFIGKAGGLVLGDCGLAFLRDGKDRATETFENVGSRDWMPGWAMGQRLSDVKPNYDVFSLGKVLWAMVAGKPILPLWYHRQPEFDLRVMFPHDESTAFVQGILDKAVVEMPADCLASATELLAEVDWAIEALAKRVRVVSGGILRTCLACAKGEYSLIANHERIKQEEFGLKVVSQPKFKIFVCNWCGHSQLFYSLGDLPMDAWPQ